jgi:5'-nucleotidase
VLSLNDLHGQLDPVLVQSGETPPRTLRVGGAEALVAQVAQIRREEAARGRAVILLDAGDFMQGSVLSNHFEGVPVRDLHVRLGVDGAAVGNHEFDFGPVGPKGTGGPDPRGALKAWAKAAPFPLLAANIAPKGGGELGWPNTRPTLLIERGGVKVGVIGLATTETPATSHLENVGDLEFAPYEPVVKKHARALRAEGAEVVVLLAHEGGSCRTRDPASCSGPMPRLLRALPRGTVDAAIAAHSHGCFWHEVNGVPLVQACSKGVALGRIAIRVRGGRVRAEALSPQVVCHDVFGDTGDCEAGLRHGPARGEVLESPLLRAHAPAVSAMRSILDGYRRRLSPRPDEVLARAARPLHHGRKGVSAMGAFVTAVMRAAVPGAEMALMNAGGVRGGFAAGPVTYADVHRVFPFDNQLAVVELTAAELREILEAYMARESHGHLIASGMAYKVRCTDPMKVVALTDSRGRPLSERRRYRVAISDFLLAGGVGFGEVLARLPASRKRLIAGRLIRDELVKSLKRLGRPLNSRAHPVLPKGPPPVVELDGPCGGAEPKAARGRPICR